MFISYRVKTDLPLVKELYWRLRGEEVIVQGRKRKLRVFWDKECLKLGEKWEDGFCKAICQSTVVVTVLSRTALASWNHLKKDSPCDNVLLEFQLALALVDAHQYLNILFLCDYPSLHQYIVHSFNLTVYLYTHTFAFSFCHIPRHLSRCRWVWQDGITLSCFNAVGPVTCVTFIVGRPK